MIFYKILKLFNKKKYLEIKYNKKKNKELEYYKKNIEPELIKIFNNINKKKKLSFIHSGHLGDLIYSLPVVKEISKTHLCNFYIKTNVKSNAVNINHPLGDVFINDKTAEMLLPLLKKQSFIKKVLLYKHENIDVNLDFFRKVPINFFFHSSRWYSHLTGIHFDMNHPVLEINKHKIITNKIVIVRSKRYRNKFINYKFLNNEKNIVFLGLKDEYDDLKKDIKNLDFYDCKDFLEMAEIIKACKCFIGNESFAFSIAEQLKVPRLLEASPEFPVVFPIGGNGKDFYHQIHFEKFFFEMTN